ncbi:helix-turn-helix domain-containing protein [Blautia argi]|uniref:HTH merR-type domain-containing protein n=1 Tax=Blautia argi TaxID=1912897 RepID=A0A2Z4U8K1_9FIRM|nr:helix-turn-helix domain-containing protein [Blautia argi]AWY97377.1 hypothetical protein DQQ01_03575 [Blautia argi]
MQKTIYSVSEAVRFLDIQSHVLRYWEEELRLPIGRNEMGHRYYTRWDIQIFMSIRELKKKGYALKEIGELTTLFYKNQVDEKQPEHRESAKKKKERKKSTPPGIQGIYGDYQQTGCEQNPGEKFRRREV